MTDRSKRSEIPGLPVDYSHARRAYGLTSALLMAWELIGLELGQTPFENFKLTLKSPQAGPYVLIVLIIYFGFRTTIEWYQADPRRRALLASRVDFTAAHIIAAAALMLYGIQTLAKVQIANTFSADRVVSFSSGMVIAQLVLMIFVGGNIWSAWKRDRFSGLFRLVILVFGLGVAGLTVLRAEKKGFEAWLFTAAGVSIGLVSFSVLFWLVRRLSRGFENKNKRF